MEDYARRNGFTNIRHFTDDGFSGVNFNRPSFQELIKEVEAGNVATIIVKDMSRLGRNYLQVGFYTEVLFPQKTFTGKMAISKEDYSQLTALAKEGITSRAEINKLEQSANYYRQKYFDSANALERMKTKYNELKEKCRPFLEALEHFPEVAKLFTEKVKQLFSFKEAQERAEKEAREKERQERIKARRNKRGMER